MGELKLCANEELVEKLNSAIENPEAFNSHCISFFDSFWKNADEIALIDVLRIIPSLAVFSGHLQHVGNGSIAVCLGLLARWMVSRARSVGINSMLDGLEDYLVNDTFTAYAVMVLSGPQFESSITDEEIPSELGWELGESIFLCPMSHVPNDRLRDGLLEKKFNFFIPFIGTVLVSPIQFSKSHVPQVQTETPCDADREERISAKDNNSEILREIYEKMDDARLCIALSRHRGIGAQKTISTVVVDDNVPVLTGSGHSIHSFQTPCMEAPIIPLQIEAAKRVFENFSILDESRRLHLRVPMGKYVESVSSKDNIQKAISLRVALESLFLTTDEKSELRYRLALRMALFLGNTIEDRREIQKGVKNIYDLCSEAIHNGRIKDKKNVFPKLFDWASELVRKAICKMIQEGGPPDWDELELASGGK